MIGLKNEFKEKETFQVLKQRRFKGRSIYLGGDNGRVFAIGIHGAGDEIIWTRRIVPNDVPESSWFTSVCNLLFIFPDPFKDDLKQAILASESIEKYQDKIRRR